ncbi:hypothetical protein D9758_002653 [Tetrapyrgos nigripes]|uniref:F-box domain-containing protein n=1 Tax=Tetrapyrgos nigripes TaxID=182062 RepID=A0A8H5LU18_9AGAR|nr:hypothetical protein D9758_002653 [Tetrapyrgos nigripes]
MDTSASDDFDILAQLRSNFGTFNGDLTYITQLLREAESTISALPTEQHRDNFLLIDRLRSLLTPIRRLPPDVLGCLFSLSCTESELADKTDCPVVNLSQVCSGWRELARATPSLWARLSMDISKSKLSVDAITSMIDTHLTLSGQCPLHLSLVLPGNTATMMDASRAILRSVASHSVRWETVCLKIFQDLLLDPNLALIRDNLPLLKHLEVWPNTEKDDEEYFPEPIPVLDVFRSAPMLRSFKLGGTDWDDEYALAEIQLPWMQLEDITLGYHRLETASQRLAEASAARAVTFYRCSEGSMTADCWAHNMQSLTICMRNSWRYEVDDFFQNFSGLTLPHLTSLRVLGQNSGYWPTEWSTMVGDFLWFLERSACSLTSFTVVNISISSFDALELLRAMPTLLHLTLHELPDEAFEEGGDTTFTDNFLQQMSLSDTSTNNHGPYLPHLQSLSFRVNSHFNTSLFVRLVRSRWIPNSEHGAEMGVGCLKKVELRFIGGIPTEADFMEEIRPLMVLRGAGLEFAMNGEGARGLVVNRTFLRRSNLTLHMYLQSYQ